MASLAVKNVPLYFSCSTHWLFNIFIVLMKIYKQMSLKIDLRKYYVFRQISLHFNQEMHRLNCLVEKKTNENLKWLASVFAAEGKIQYVKMTPRMCYRYKGLKRSLDDNFHLCQKQLIIILLKNESYDIRHHKNIDLYLEKWFLNS